MKKFISKYVEAEWRYNLKRQIQENFKNERWANGVKRGVLPQILGLIDRGISPVKGRRMFPKYKDPDKYPGGLKPSNKPNLKLENKMLKHYDVRPHQEMLTITLGIHADAPEEERIKAIANNEGTKNSKGEVAIAARRFIPLKNESYSTSIMLEIRKIFATILSRAINKRR